MCKLTVIWLKLLFTATFTIFLQISLSTRASVVITCERQTSMCVYLNDYVGLWPIAKEHTPSIVAMFGWIIPEPFAIPPTRIVVPPTCDSTATLLLTRSVVVIAIAAESALYIKKLIWFKRMYICLKKKVKTVWLKSWRRQEDYCSTESDIELTSDGSASRSSFCKSVLR